jgi:hypothetical protein
MSGSSVIVALNALALKRLRLRAQCGYDFAAAKIAVRVTHRCWTG